MKRARRVSIARLGEGPFYADLLRDGDGYELSLGHAIICEPSGKDHTRPHLVGSLPLASDPAVRDGGVEAGHALGPKTLRAPDISIGDLGEGEGTWSTVAPPLAVEYAARGQVGPDLRRKIKEFLSSGTRFVWVVRLVGPRRVEVYKQGEPVQIKRPGERLMAPGVLKNALPVEALYDRDASFEHTLKNLLERKGYVGGLDAVRAEAQRKGRVEGRVEGRAKGKAEGLRRAVEALCSVLGVSLTPVRRTRLEAMGIAELEALVETLRRTKRWPRAGR